MRKLRADFTTRISDHLDKNLLWSSLSTCYAGRGLELATATSVTALLICHSYLAYSMKLGFFLKGKLCPCGEASHMTLEDGEEIKYNVIVMTDVDWVGWLASRPEHLNSGVCSLEC